jgi:hypothetical protein
MASRSRSKSRSSPRLFDQKNAKSSGNKQVPMLSVPVGIFLVFYVIFSTAVPCYYHYIVYNKINYLHCALAFFLPLNTLICFWEISLFCYIDEIKADFKKLEKQYRGNELSACMDFFSAPLTISEAFSLKFWLKVWSTYALYDPSYANKESFGFFVDVSNGFCFLIPSIIFLYGMTYDLIYQGIVVEARTLGIMGLIKFYVEFHGTVVYFCSYFLNGRQKGFSNTEVGLFVGFSNGLWFVFPLLGVYACYHMIMTNSFDVLR